MTLERIDAGVARWVEVLGPAAQLAERIASTDFVPRAMRGNPAVVVAAIMYGDELGLGPMQALAGIHVVEGRPQPSAELMRALILRAGHSFTVHEMTATRCRVSGLRAGRPEGERVYVEWTADMARAAGLAGKAGWRAYPRALLVARASSDLARILFPDVVRGLGYAAEALDELPDLDGWEQAPEPEADPADPPAPRRKTRARSGPRIKEPGRLPPATADHPAPDGSVDVPLPTDPTPPPDPPTVTTQYQPEPDPDDPEQPPRPIEPNTLRLIMASWRRAGLAGPDREKRLWRLAVTSAVVGRDITTTAELTQSEALGLIRAINDLETGALVAEDDGAGGARLTVADEPPPPEPEP